jgi:hypothetical protein
VGNSKYLGYAGAARSPRSDRGTRESGDVELRDAYRLSVPASAGTCVYYRQPTAAAGFSTESLRASRQRGRPPASAVPPPRPERKVGARAIHAGPITPTTNRARTAQPRRYRPPHMPMCYMHATMHHAEHHAHLIYMRCEREGPCSVWPTRHDFGRVPVRVSATPCRDSVLGFMDVTSSHIPPRLPS